MAPAPCKSCGKRPKITGRHRCAWCSVMAAPIGEQVDAARERRAFVPDDLAPARVAERLWPTGSRWCSGCRSFVPLEYVATGASRCRACQSATTHAARIEKTYGLTAADYDALLGLQGGKCAICRGAPKSKRLAVDHDHKSGAVRGLLCSRCNHDLLGSAWDSLALAHALVTYLDTPPAAGSWIAPEALPPKTRAAAPSAELSLVTGHGHLERPALAAALERAATASTETYPPLVALFAELEAVLVEGNRAALVDAVTALRARGFLQPTPF